MKSLSLLALAVTLTALFLVPARAANEFDPVEATLVDRAAVMKLPDGVRRIRLRIKQEDGTWKTCTIAHLEGSEGYLKLRLPDGVAECDLELTASYTDPFPYSFYQGISNHPDTESETSTVMAPTAGPEQFGGVRAGDDTGGAEPVVEESDIWKWRGSTLYFFNQYRGLQVINVSDPAAPERLGSLRVPSQGEQLYLHPTEDYVILLTYDYSTGNGEVVLVEHELTHVIQQRASLPVPGYILESRLVGEILYVVSRNSWQETTTGPDGVEHITWRSGLNVTKIDLTDPANPVASDPLVLSSDRYNYWGAQVQATSKALLVATNAYDSARRQSVSTVHVVDIADQSADPVVTHHLPVAGQVLKKFNLNLNGDILTAVSQVWRGNTTRRRYASVETFDLSRTTPKLAGIEFANNESITATRFVGDLLYVVTFLRVDPLFVISLADPAQPRILSELVIPGFSTYLQPLGDDALISIGVEGSQIAVSWFDVGDPTAPTLASRVFIGADEGRSWTEANWDEKALGFFPADNLLLVPFQGSVPGAGWMSGVQLVDLGEGELTKRGSFEHEFQARRARLLDEAVVSISGRSLKTLDVSDRDNPLLLAELTLAWPADIVHRVGDSLVQLERGPGYWWYGSNDTPPRLHVSPVEDSDELLTSLDLPGGRITGSFLKDDCLFVAQSQMSSAQVNSIWTYSETFTTTVIDLGDPDRPVILGRTFNTQTETTYRYGFGSDYIGALLPDGSLVWYPAEQSGFYPFYDLAPADSRIGGALVGGDAFFPYYPSSGRVYTVDIFDKTQPEILAATDLKTGENAWPEGQLRLVGSTLYYGLQSSGHLVNPDGSYRWFSRHSLGHLDLSQPDAPAHGDLVKIPGTFEHALATPAGGTVIFTSQVRYERDPSGVYQVRFRIKALAFDGIDAFLINELVADDKGYGPKLFDSRSIILGKTDYTSGQPTTDLTVYEWSNAGAFAELRTFQLPISAYKLGIVDHLLIAGGSNQLTFIDFVDPADPASASVAFPNVPFWQRVSLIDIHEREVAHVPRGFSGVETLDFEGTFAGSVPIPSPRPSQNPDREWTSVPLPMLIMTSTGDPLLLGALPDGEEWMFTDGIAQYDYEAWTRMALGLAPGDPVPSFATDTDGDGKSNGWEFLTGTHSGDIHDLSTLHVSMTSDENGTHLTGRLPINPHAAASLVIVPELSYDLEHWTAAPASIDLFYEDFHPGIVLRLNESGKASDKAFLRAVLSVAP